MVWYVWLVQIIVLDKAENQIGETLLTVGGIANIKFFVWLHAI